MGYIPPKRPQPPFECPRDISFGLWRAAIEELNRDCPPPLGLYDRLPEARPHDPVVSELR